jgi:hypothetical protein
MAIGLPSLASPEHRWKVSARGEAPDAAASQGRSIVPTPRGWQLRADFGVGGGGYHGVACLGSRQSAPQSLVYSTPSESRPRIFCEWHRVRAWETHPQARVSGGSFVGPLACCGRLYIPFSEGDHRAKFFVCLGNCVEIQPSILGNARKSLKASCIIVLDQHRNKTQGTWRTITTIPGTRDRKNGGEATKTFELCGHQESDEPYIP